MVFMGQIMKKYFKFWPILGLILLFSAHFTYARPRSAEKVLGISSDTTFERCYVHVTEWNESIPSTKSTELTEAEFKYVVEMMKTNNYRKYSGNKSYKSNTGSYYSITLIYFMNGNKEGYQTTTITKGGLIDINGSWYSVASEEEIAKEMMSEIYEYIYNFL